MPPASQRRQGLARPQALQSGPRRSRDAASTSDGRQTYGGISSQRRRSRQQQQHEDDEDEEDGQRGGDEAEAEGMGNGQNGATAADDDDDEDDGDGAYSVKKRQKLPLSDAVKAVVKGIGRPEIERNINDLVRLALFSEYRRAPIRREEITKKVLGKAGTRAFPYVFNRAQAILREVFCFEMVQLRTRGTDNDALTQSIPTPDTGKGKKRARTDEADKAEEAAEPMGSTTKTYAVRSILPTVVIKAMAEPNAAVTAAALSNGDGPSEAGTASMGALLDWQKADGQLGSLGLTFLILSLILLNGRTLSDDQFRALLHRLGLEDSGQLPDTLRPDSLAAPPPELDASQSHRSYRRATKGRGGAGAPSDTIAHPSTLQTFLSQLLRQGYLETVKTNRNTGAISRRGGGGRTSGGGRRGGEENNVESVEWKWGPRAEVEIGEEAVATFIRDVYIDADPDNAPPSTAGGIAEASARAADADDDDETPGDSSRFIGRANGNRNPRGRASTQGDASSSGVVRGRRSSGFGENSEQREKREKQRQTLRREIERAAGSQLIG